MQNTSELLMIQPCNFGYNQETAVNNSFQQVVEGDIQQKALAEFNSMVELLHDNDLHVTVVKDSPLPFTPDSIFPNNWISFHENGNLFLYPMFAPNRRAERKPAVVESISHKYIVNEIVDLSPAEANARFLEGTGSMVLDRENKIAYACLSPRTNSELLNQFCDIAGYSQVSFSAADKNRDPIYHTNVMMCIGKTFAVICLDAIPDAVERNRLIDSLSNTKKEIIEITVDQMNHFAGNMLQVINIKAELLLVMSSQAFNALTADQIKKLQHHNRILHAPLDTIEAAGGGSARCMIAEIFLQPK